MIINTDNLSYEEVNDVIIKLQKLAQSLYPEYARRQQEKYKKNYEARQKERENFEKEILPLIEAVVADLPPGTFIKMKGTRDKGYRVLESISKNVYSHAKLTLNCRQVQYSRDGKTYKLGQYTSHMSDKITHVKTEKGWEKIKDLI